MMKKLKRFFRENSFYHGKWLRLDKGKNGQDLISRTTDEYYFSGVNILALREKEVENKTEFRIVAIGNYRIPAGRRILEVPAGLAEKNLTVDENIKKELREETGYQDIDIWQDLGIGETYGDPQRSPEHAYIRAGVIKSVKFLFKNSLKKDVKKEKCKLEVEENIKNYEILLNSEILKSALNLCQKEDMDLDGNMSCMLLGLDIFFNDFKS